MLNLTNHHWQRGKNRDGISPYFIQNSDYTICKIGIKPTYELWKKSERLGIFANSDLAKQHFNELNKGE